jgi:ubiquinone/menaquinone biosynthesis C-methylase UbiE
MSQTVTKATLAAYERWAPLYPPIAHNPLMRAEQHAMLQHWPDVTARRALDLGCGSGRYAKLLAAAGASEIVAVDYCTAMLAQVSGAHRVCASMMHLPFTDEAFGVVVSGLAIGHAPSVTGWMAEISRVLRAGGTLLYSDFHPESARAGLTRSFKDGQNRTCTVPHSCHAVAVQKLAADAAKLTVEAIAEVRVGIELQEKFPKSDDFYRQWHGLPLVLIVRARK